MPWLAAVTALLVMVAVLLGWALRHVRAALGGVDVAGERLSGPVGAAAAATALAEVRARSEGVRAALDRRAGSAGPDH